MAIEEPKSPRDAPMFWNMNFCKTLFFMEEHNYTNSQQQSFYILHFKSFQLLPPNGLKDFENLFNF